jgi:hypothetical protein
LGDRSPKTGNYEVLEPDGGKQFGSKIDNAEPKKGQAVQALQTDSKLFISGKLATPKPKGEELEPPETTPTKLKGQPPTISPLSKGEDSAAAIAAENGKGDGTTKPPNHLGNELGYRNGQIWTEETEKRGSLQWTELDENVYENEIEFYKITTKNKIGGFTAFEGTLTLERGYIVLITIATSIPENLEGATSGLFLTQRESLKRLNIVLVSGGDHGVASDAIEGSPGTVTKRETGLVSVSKFLLPGVYDISASVFVGAPNQTCFAEISQWK